MRTSFAIIALLGTSAAYKLKIRDDLFDDNGDVEMSLQSIKAAEKEHGTTFRGLSQEEQKDVVYEKANMVFQGDEFIKNDKRFGVTLLQLDERVYPEPRPIGEMLAFISDDVFNKNGMLRSAHDDMQILAGDGLNDEDEFNSTLESLKAAERISGKHMDKGAELIGKESKVINFLEDDHRIHTSELNDALMDKETEDRLEAQRNKVKQQAIA